MVYLWLTLMPNSMNSYAIQRLETSSCIKLCVYYTTTLPLQSTAACVYTVTVLSLVPAALPRVVFCSSSLCAHRRRPLTDHHFCAPIVFATQSPCSTQ
jgi:hypothetical protein